LSWIASLSQQILSQATHATVFFYPVVAVTVRIAFDLTKILYELVREGGKSLKTINVYLNYRKLLLLARD